MTSEFSLIQYVEFLSYIQRWLVDLSKNIRVDNEYLVVSAVSIISEKKDRNTHISLWWGVFFISFDNFEFWMDRKIPARHSSM